MSKLDEFKEFVRKHPLIKNEVYQNKKTWQQLYEDFVILGSDSFNLSDKEDTDSKSEKKEKSSVLPPEDLVKQVINYVKKIDPDQVTKTVTSIQKVLELFGSFKGASSSALLAKKSTGDPLFDKRFDEWY